MFALEGAGFLVVVVTHFRSKDNIFPRPKRHARGERRIESAETGPLALEIIEELQPRRAAQARRERIREIIEHTHPVGIANVRYVRCEPEEGLEAEVQA